MIIEADTGQIVPGDNFDPATSTGSQLSLLSRPDQAALALSASVPLADLNLIELLLQDKRSPATRRAYEGDLRRFFYFVRNNRGPLAGETPPEPTRAEVGKFLALPRQKIAIQLALWKAELRVTGQAEASINRSLAAIKSLLKFAHRLELCATDGRNLVDGEKVENYRDTAGLSLELVTLLLKQPAKLHGTTVRGLRDKAILDLLFENGLRRSEVCKLDVGDFSLPTKRLAILGKGRGSQKEYVTISRHLTNGIGAYLLAAGHEGDKGPLFRNLHHDPAKAGERLTTNGLWWLVKTYGTAIGVENLAPHKMRHSSITALSKATNGNVTKIKKFSRHKKTDTVMLYVDHAQDAQGEMTNLLSALVNGPDDSRARRRR